MTTDAFRHLVLTLAQRCYVRSWRRWPEANSEPVRMAVSVQAGTEREQWDAERLLKRLGFQAKEGQGRRAVWVVERTEA